MGGNIFRRAMTRLLFELQVALSHQPARGNREPQKSPFGASLGAIILQLVSSTGTSKHNNDSAWTNRDPNRWQLNKNFPIS